MRQLMSIAALSLVAACSATPPAEIPRREKPTPTMRPDDPQPTPVGNLDPGVGDPSAPDTFPTFAPADDEAVAKAAEGQNALAVALYSELRGTRPGNFAMSPSSIALAFGMTYAGARGETARQMAIALRHRLPQTELHRAFGTMLRGWNSDEKRPYELQVVNRLFGQESFAFRQPYLDVTSDHYQSELERLDFAGAPDEARKHINAWVEKQTHERIKDLLPDGSILPITRLVLTNAIYFKGKWKQAFEENATADAPFYAPSGQRKAPTMHQTAVHRYAELDGAKMLEMQYEGDDLSMQLILPDAVDGLPALEKKLAAGAIDALAKQLGSEEVTVSLPRFTIAPDAPMSLKATFEAMGMTDAFDPTQSDLSGMADLPPDARLFIQDAFHKAFVEVQEKGTVAAAATGVVVGNETSVEPPPKEFRADHPFLFIIRDNHTGAMLFMGRVESP